MKPFQSINEAVRSTGLSAYFLRRGCQDGSVPHIMSGSKYLVNVPALLRKLGVPDESEQRMYQAWLEGGSRNEAIV